MTGANRLLIGLGWATVVLIACSRARIDELVIDTRQRLEMRYLVWATLYSFLIPIKGTINLFDAVVLLALFLFYAAAAMRSESHDVELVGPAALIDREFRDTGRRLWAIGLFAVRRLRDLHLRGALRREPGRDRPRPRDRRVPAGAVGGAARVGIARVPDRDPVRACACAARSASAR